MRVEIFCLCKDVKVNALMHTSLIDIFDSMVAKAEPALIPAFYTMTVIRFRESDEGKHILKYRIRDKTGKDLAAPKTEVIDISEIPHPSMSVVVRNYIPPALFHFGEYSFSIECEGKQIAETSLYISLGSLSSS